MKEREEIKAGGWKNERKQMDVAEMISRLETQYHAMKDMLERHPENERLQGNIEATKEHLHLLLNWTGN